MTGRGALDADDIRALLGELGRELERQGLRAELFIVGGAAMALAYTDRRLTVDVDAIFAPKREVYEAAQAVAARHDLPGDWLNDGVKGLLPGDDPQRQEIQSLPGISWQVASPRYLLALKVAAARIDRDADDIRALARLCGYVTADEVIANAAEVFGERAHLLTPRSEFFVRELLDSPAREADVDLSPNDSD